MKTIGLLDFLIFQKQFLSQLNEFGNILVLLSTSETHVTLSHALRHSPREKCDHQYTCHVHDYLSKLC